MKKYSNLIIVILTFIILIVILFNKTIISETIINSFYIWFNTLVPSMLPMFIISDILINYNFTKYIPNKIINFISKIFNISNNATLIVLLSLVSGFPLNAMNIITSYNNNLISKEEAEHLLLFNHFPNPLFVLNTVGILYLNSNKYGIIILISTYLSSIILGILVRNKNTLTNNNCITKSSKSQTFTEIFSSSIKKSINSLLMISVTVCLFLILSTLIINIFHLNSYLSLGIKSILEMTMGLEHLSKMNISNIFKVILSSSIISFGGLSIHMQVISILDERIRYRNYFIGRIYQVLISLIISLILFYVI